MLGNGIKQAGTGAAVDITLAASGSYPPFSSRFSTGTTGDPFEYTIIRDSDGVALEYGIGHLSTSTNLVRDRIMETWNGTTLNYTNPTATDITSGGPYSIICGDSASMRQLAPVGTDTTVNASLRFIMGGQWCANAGAGVAMVAGTSQTVPFRLDLPVTSSGISLKVTTLAATGTTKNARCAIYRMDKNGHPGNLIAETTATTVASTGIKQFLFASSIRLDPGWYFISALADGNPSVSGTNAQGGAGVCPMWGNSAGDPTGRLVTAAKAVTYADTGACFPSTFGTTGITYGVDFATSCICPSLMVTS